MDDLQMTALRLADMAVPLVREAWFGGGALDYKADGSVVTRADLAVEELWRAHLQKHHPEHGILGEEYGATAGRAELTWVLDPIDGTRQFATGLANFATLIALCRGEVPVLGVIDLPLLGARYVGMAGRQTTLNGAPVSVSQVGALAEARLALANPDSFAGSHEAAFQALRRGGRFSAFDGGSPAYGALARGRIDLCLNGPDLDAYDICALVPVVEGAGGRITGWGGERLGLGSSGAIVAAATDALHQAALDLIASV